MYVSMYCFYVCMYVCMYALYTCFSCMYVYTCTVCKYIQYVHHTEDISICTYVCMYVFSNSLLSREVWRRLFRVLVQRVAGHRVEQPAHDPSGGTGSTRMYVCMHVCVHVCVYMYL